MKIHIKLNQRKSKETPQGFPIIIYVTQHRKEKEWRTGFFCKKSQWNDSLTTPTRKHSDYYVISRYLQDLKKRIQDIYLDSPKRGMTFEEIKERLFATRTQYFYDAVYDSFDPNYRGTDWSAVRAFERLYPDLRFDEITNQMARRFRDRLLKQGNKPSGVDSYVRSLRAVWNRHSDKPNPFKGITTEIPDTIKTVASVSDITKLKEAELVNNSSIGGHYHFRNYWLLMFYLGGIDPEVLSKLRYDQHFVNGRIQFNRDKGRSKTRCSNFVFPEALEILKNYKTESYPYFVPIHKATNYKTFSGNFTRRLKELAPKLELSIPLRPKSARYTFIDRAQQLLIDERVTAQIVGHKRKTTTSIYTNDFPLKVQDDSHQRIISLKQSSKEEF